MPSARIRFPLALVLLAGCTSFEETLARFDRVAGIDDAEAIPQVLAYERNVEAWKATAALDDSSVPSDALANPAGFARAQVVAMVEFARGDLRGIAEVAPRLLMVAAADPNALNRIEAVEGMAELLGDLGADPIERIARQDQASARARGDRILTALRTLGPQARAPAELAEPDRASYLEALASAGDGALETPADDITIARLLAAAELVEPVGELAVATRTALREALANSLSRALLSMLRSPDVRLRETASHALFRLGGPRALPVILAALSRGDSGRFRYPLIARERRSLLRLCSQCGGEVLFASFVGGPRPIEFIYDTVARDEEEGLRLIALETMARCLGRAISFDRSWADAWWREYALNGAAAGRLPAATAASDAPSENR